jgi:MFS family permease
MTAAAMGFAGDYFAPNAIFIAAALLCVPALIALGFISPQEIDYARARNAGNKTQKYNIVSVRELAKNRSLVLFMAALVVFQLADASMLPLVGEQLAATGQPQSSLFMSGLIMIPQIVVALLAPWVGYHSEKRGRRPLLLAGFGVEIVRAALLALSANYAVLAIAQLLDGITGAIIGVLTVLVISDLTAGTGRFNLARGTAGAMSGVAGSVSTMATGFLVQGIGRSSSFWIIAVVACAATALIGYFLSETASKSRED